MAADFSNRVDKFDERKGFSRIRWGNRSKPLDIELTELQKIIWYQMDLIGTASFTGDGFFSLPALGYTVDSSGTLTLPASKFCVGGRVIQMDSDMSITGAAGTTIWLAVWEQEVSYTDNAVKYGGNISGGANIPDLGIYSTEIGEETSKRVQIQMQLSPNTADATKSYLPVATISAGGTVTDNRVAATGASVFMPGDGQFSIASTTNMAEGNYSYASGYLTEADGIAAHAEGSSTMAAGDYSHAEGQSSLASGAQAHAEGFSTGAYGIAAHAEGYSSIAKGDYTHAEGYGTYAATRYSHAEGVYTTTSNVYSKLAADTATNMSVVSLVSVTGFTAGLSVVFAQFDAGSPAGFGLARRTIQSVDTNANTITLESPVVYNPSVPFDQSASATTKFTVAGGGFAVALGVGLGGHAEGTGSITSGSAAHAEGWATLAVSNGTHAEGYGTQATSQYSHAEGYKTVASASAAHAEGYQTTASSTYAHAEGYNTTASGSGSHAEGSTTTASTTYAHAEGYNTTASGSASHTEGYMTSASSIGGHTEGQYTKVVLSASASAQARRNTEVITGIMSVYSGHAEGVDTRVTGAGGHAEGLSTLAEGTYTHAEGSFTRATGNASHSEGTSTIVMGDSSHVEGSGAFSGYAEYITGANGAVLTMIATTTLRAGDIVTSSLNPTSTTTYTVQSVSGATVTLSTTPSTNSGYSAGYYLCLVNRSIAGYAVSAHAEGYRTSATGMSAHAEGTNTVASGDNSHAEGSGALASGTNSHAEGASSRAVGSQAHAEGYFSAASAVNAHTEGSLAFAGYWEPSAGISGSVISISNASHQFKAGDIIASGTYMDSGGFAVTSVTTSSITLATTPTATLFAAGNRVCLINRVISGMGDNAHVEGLRSLASGTNAHAEGSTTIASGGSSHAEGDTATASGYAAHAEGANTTASGGMAHAEGWATTASGSYSHAEGQGSVASGAQAHAGGYYTTASGYNSIAHGVQTTSDTYAGTAFGAFNKAMVGSGTSFQGGSDALVIGNGTSTSAKSNSFRVTFNGYVYGLAAFNSTGADYAEYFEWEDGNPASEDRVGYFVALVGDKVRKATSSDRYILGVVSATPSVIGDSDIDNWNEMYLRDEWGRIQYHNVTVPAEKDAEGNILREERVELHPIYNPNWNPDEEYIPREKRSEWSPIGLIGKLRVRDDGTAKVGGFVLPNDDGVATQASEGYMVLKRLSGNIIQVLVLPRYL